MSYAIKNDGTGWRTVNGPEDVAADETFSATQPGPIQPTPDQVRKQYEAAAQMALDAVAQSWGYDSANSAISYVGSSNTKWNAEGLAIRTYRDAFWTAANAIEVSVAGGATMPATAEAFVAMLPAAPARPA